MIESTPQDLGSGYDARMYGLGYTWHGGNNSGTDAGNRWSIPTGWVAGFMDLFPSTENIMIGRFLLSERNWVDQMTENSDAKHCRAKPFVFSSWPTANSDRTFLSNGPRARHFPQLGVVFMNSGWGPDATYACFLGGTPGSRNHRQYEEGHFVLYKKGYLAMDRGTRCNQFDPDGHCENFYNNSIAHNVMLIKDPSETWTTYNSNDGGMYRKYGTTMQAFEMNSTFTYAACDLTAAYRSSKVSEVIRQFLFIYPDYFVVFDRVTSINASFKKTFVHHTQESIVHNGVAWQSDHMGGRVFVKTLLPTSAIHTVVPGWISDGKDYPPINCSEDDLGPNNFRGQYRMEVSPATASLKDTFLHVFQVADKTLVNTMVSTTLESSGTMKGVSFVTREGLSVKAMFNESGSIGGYIVLNSNTQPFSTTVQPQSGFAAGSGGGTSTETVATPTITPSSGSFRGSAVVTMWCATAGAEIRYTLNGMNPTTGDLLYTVPFAVSTTSVVKARGFKEWWNPSAVATASYTVYPARELVTRYAVTPTVIDGVLDEYAGVPAAVFADSSGRGERDNVATVRCRWDERYLYVAYEVTDTQLNADVTVSTGSIWLDDTMELWIDPRNDKSGGTDDRHVFVNLRNVQRVMEEVWPAGTMLSSVTLLGTLGNNADTDTGHRIEAAIPWLVLGGSPAAGGRIGIDFIVGDKDLPGDGYQTFDWVGLALYAQLSLWGELVLMTSSETPANQAPVVAMTSPTNGSTYNAPANITLAATATDPDGTIAAVRFYSGATLLNLDTASPYTYTWTGVSSGTYQLYATATDNQGAVSTSAVVNVTVYPPNQPPTVTMTSPVNGSTYTAPATLNLAATATDPDGTIANVRFYRGTTLLATDTASPYEYTWANVSSGTYQLRAVAQDNQGTTSTSTVVTVTVLSSSTPAVWYTLTATVNPANGGTVSPASGTYLAGSQIQVTATPNTNYTFANWSGDATGTNPTVTITMDADKSIVANFTYVPPANSSPTVSITSPSDGATYTAPASITITATATDSDGSVAVVRFYSGTTVLGADSASPYEYTWTGVGAGNYILTAQAVDNQGAVGTSAAVGITVNAQPVYYTLTVNVNPTNGGTVALNPPPSGSGYLAGTQVAVTATPNAGYVFTGWSGDASGANATITLTMDGNKTITAQFTPVASNVTLTVTANPVNAGTIVLNPPGGSYAPGTTVAVTATPGQGYVFNGWTGGVVSTANPLNVTVNANMTLVANFTVVPSTSATPDVQPGTVRIIGGLDGYVNTAYENSMSILFQPRRTGTVYIRVYSLNGRLVREGVVSGTLGTVSSFNWDLKNNDGTVVSAGVYIVYVKGGGLDIKKKIVVLN